MVAAPRVHAHSVMTKDRLAALKAAQSEDDGDEEMANLDDTGGGYMAEFFEQVRSFLLSSLRQGLLLHAMGVLSLGVMCMLFHDCSECGSAFTRSFVRERPCH